MFSSVFAFDLKDSEDKHVGINQQGNVVIVAFNCVTFMSLSYHCLAYA